MVERQTEVVERREVEDDEKLEEVVEEVVEELLKRRAE